MLATLLGVEIYLLRVRLSRLNQTLQEAESPGLLETLRGLRLECEALESTLSRLEEHFGYMVEGDRETGGVPHSVEKLPTRKIMLNE